MAMVGAVMTSQSRTNDLCGFLRLDPVTRLNDLDGFVDLPDIGVALNEVGNLKSLPKKADHHHHHPAFSRFRARQAKPVKTVSKDSQDPRLATRTPTVPSHANQLPLGTVKSCSSCRLFVCNCPRRDVWLPVAESRTSFFPYNVYDCEQRGPEKQGMIKRSISAASDHARSGHPLTNFQSTVHPSCISGQRLAEWHDPSSFDADGRKEVLKRFSLCVEDQRQRTTSEKSQAEPKDAKSSAISDVLSILRGPSYNRQDTSITTDRSPLIELDQPSIALARNTFDNVAATDNTSISRNSSEVGLPGQDLGRNQVEERRPDPTLPSSWLQGDGDPTLHGAQKPFSPGLRNQDGKKRRWFPALRVKIPESDDSSTSPKLNIKKLSAAEERKIDEALELAGTFARLGTSDHSICTPRTPGASSRESKESLSGSSESPTSHFRFNIFKIRKEEKKTFVEELASHLTDPRSLLTPEALDAYEKLVAKSGIEEEDQGAKSRPAKQVTRQAHRFSLRTKLLQRVRVQRHSLSESDKGSVPENILQKNPVKVESRSSRLLRSASTGSTLKFQKASYEQNLFAWFDRNPLNTTRPERPPRPKSLQTDINTGDGTNAYPMSMPLSPVMRLPPREGRETCPPLNGTSKKAEGLRRSPPLLPTDTELDQPPAIPPRVPLRQSTVNTKPRQRRHPLPGGIADKQRSYSEGISPAPTSQDFYSLRRSVHSTAPGERSLFLSEPHSPLGPKQLNLTSDSDDSVFYHIMRSPGSAIPQGGSGVSKGLRQYRSLSVKNVKVNAEELGISDKNDPFWLKNVSLDDSYSESDLLREALAPIPGRYETSDCISYEDLMEFALDGPQHKDSVDLALCDEIRVMRKMFSNDVTISDCMEALVETGWNVFHAVKLVKLKQLLSTGLGTQDQCKDALMACKWNVDEAATFLLPPPSV